MKVFISCIQDGGLVNSIPNNAVQGDWTGMYNKSFKRRRITMLRGPQKLKLYIYKASDIQMKSVLAHLNAY